MFYNMHFYAKIRDSCGEEHSGQIVVRVNYKSRDQLGSVSHCVFSSNQLSGPEDKQKSSWTNLSLIDFELDFYCMSSQKKSSSKETKKFFQPT